MTGTMMQYPLTLTSLFERAGKLFPDVEIVSRRPTLPSRNLRLRRNYGSITTCTRRSERPGGDSCG
jgi:hypothetical protein